MNQYKRFLEINPKYIYQIVDFITNNCPVMMYKLPYIVMEKHISSVEDPDLQQRKILKDLSLKDLKKISISKLCDLCNLCDKKIFKEKRNLLKAIKHKLHSDDTHEKEKVEIIKKLNNEIKEIKLQLIRGSHGRLALKKADNLYQLVLVDFLENLIPEINTKVEQKIENVLYFEQITRAILVTDRFLEDIKVIRNKYFKKIKSGDFTKYELTKESIKDKSRFHKYLEDAKKLMTIYNFTKRWSSYIMNGMLRFQADKEGRLIISKNQPKFCPPDGLPFITQVVKGNKTWNEMTLVGDEDKRDIKRMKEKYNIKKVIRLQDKFRKKPIDNFVTYLRWYISHQKYLEHNRKYKSDKYNYIKNIYTIIFYDDMDSFKDEWPNDYKEGENSIAIQKKAEIRIRNGIRKIEDLVYDRIK